jgi:hypothetical protein
MSAICRVTMMRRMARAARRAVARFAARQLRRRVARLRRIPRTRA